MSGTSATDNGFRGISWGQNIDSVQRMVLFGQDKSGDHRVYLRPADSMRMGLAELTSITYDFYDGGFAGAIVLCQGKGQRNFNELRQSVEASCGQKNQGLGKFATHRPCFCLVTNRNSIEKVGEASDLFGTLADVYIQLHDGLPARGIFLDHGQSSIALAYNEPEDLGAFVICSQTVAPRNSGTASC